MALGLAKRESAVAMNHDENCMRIARAARHQFGKSADATALKLPEDVSFELSRAAAGCVYYVRMGGNHGLVPCRVREMSGVDACMALALNNAEVSSPMGSTCNVTAMLGGYPAVMKHAAAPFGEKFRDF